MNDFKIIKNDNYPLLRKHVIELLNEGYTVINVWPVGAHECYVALQKIDPIVVAAYANQSWGDR